MTRAIVVPDSDLRALLLESGLDVVAADAQPCALILSPRVTSGETDVWCAAEGVIVETYAAARDFFLRALERSNVHGHLIILSPADCAMGDPNDLAGSILAGALISLKRTLALEFLKHGFTANCIFVGYRNKDILDLETLARTIRLLAEQPGATITGQEIFLAAGLESGRLKP